MARGTVQIDSRRCKGCGLCIAVCPQQVLAFSSELNAHGYHPVMLVEESAACTGCALCAVVCPDVVFAVYREPMQPRTHAQAGVAALRRAGSPPKEGIHERAMEG